MLFVLRVGRATSTKGLIRTLHLGICLLQQTTPELVVLHLIATEEQLVIGAHWQIVVDHHVLPRTINP